MGLSNPKSGETNKLKTLIVEDHALFRQTFKEGLQALFPSMMIQEAAEGRDGLQKVDTFHPELIFMDIQLPGENGLELTKRIKASYPHIQIIILTSHDIPEYREAASRCGASCLMGKGSLNWKVIEILVKSIASVG